MAVKENQIDVPSFLRIGQKTLRSFSGRKSENLDWRANVRWLEVPLRNWSLLQVLPWNLLQQPHIEYNPTALVMDGDPYLAIRFADGCMVFNFTTGCRRLHISLSHLSFAWAWRWADQEGSTFESSWGMYARCMLRYQVCPPTLRVGASFTGLAVYRHGGIFLRRNQLDSMGNEKQIFQFRI